MADFIEKTMNKTAVRDLTIPIPNVETFDDLIVSIIDDNPFDCIGYVKDGVEMPAVARHREHYTLMSELCERRQEGRGGLAPVPDDRCV